MNEEFPTPEKSTTDLQALAMAMNNLAEALNNTNASIDSIKNLTEEDGNWKRVPSILMELNKRLMVLATRL